MLVLCTQNINAFIQKVFNKDPLCYNPYSEFQGHDE